MTLTYYRVEMFIQLRILLNKIKNKNTAPSDILYTF